MDIGQRPSDKKHKKAMKESIIIYGSRYGTARRYAERLAEMTGIRCIGHKDLNKADGYERVIYVGALYAGSVLGLKALANVLNDQELIVVTVGLVDPQDEENVRHIRQNIRSQIPARLYDEGKIFHLRGAIDYSTMGLKHRLMMAFVRSRLAKMPEDKLNAEAKIILETYGKSVDFVDFDSLEAIKELIS